MVERKAGPARQALRAALTCALASACAVLGCGAEGRPPPQADATGAAPGASAGDGFSTDGTKPPGCGIKDDGSHCDCLDVPLFGERPNVYFVLDRSGSMADDGKWDQVRVTVGRLMRALGPRASFGATLFPGGGSACAAGAEVMSVRQGDPPSSEADGPTTRTLLDVTRVRPQGGTPTAATLEGALPRLAALPGKTYVLLATDGGPNCNDQASCAYDACMPNIENVPGCPQNGPENCCEPPRGYRENCLDGPRSVAAVGALRDAGIPVFVVGIPGSAPYAAVLDALAVAGGTAHAASPKYYRVDTAETDALLATLKRVAAQIVATCELRLREPPADPGLVNVYLDDVPLAPDPTDGWVLEGDTVRLVGDACARVMRGDVLDVRVIAGCPTFAPR